MISRIFSVSGKPRGKGRPRMTRKGWVYTPRATRQYEKLIRQAYQKEYKDALPLTCPVKVVILASFQTPKKASRPYPARPDLDNIVKVVMDALNGLAWADDSQVVSIQAEKHFYHPAELIVIIQEAYEG